MNVGDGENERKQMELVMEDTKWCPTSKFYIHWKRKHQQLFR